MNRTLIAFINKELVQTLRDKKMRALVFVMPVIQMTVFGLAISTEIRNIKLASFVPPGDYAARRLSDKFIASGWFKPVKFALGEDPHGLIASGRADAVLIPPPGGLARAGERGRGKIQLLVDASNAAKARAVEAYAKNIIAAAYGEKGGAAGMPLKISARVLYNPAMESSIFMVPGVMSMIVCLITIILTAMSLTREREMGTFETIVSAPLENREILLGKTIPYILLGLVETAIVITAAFLIFGIPVRGPIWQLALCSLIFVITTVSVGTLISTISRNQQQAMLGGFLFLFPAMLLSGIMFPVENMPGALIFAAYLDPLMYFVALLRNIMLKGGDMALFWKYTGVMALMAAAAVALAFKRFRQTLN